MVSACWDEPVELRSSGCVRREEFDGLGWSRVVNRSVSSKREGRGD